MGFLKYVPLLSGTYFFWIIADLNILDLNQYALEIYNATLSSENMYQFAIGLEG